MCDMIKDRPTWTRHLQEMYTDVVMKSYSFSDFRVNLVLERVSFTLVR